MTFDVGYGKRMMKKCLLFKIDSPKRRLSIFLGVILNLLIPLIAMQFTEEVQWTKLDFIAAGILLCGAGIVLDFIFRTSKSFSQRIGALIFFFIALFFIWAELSVGIIGTPFAGN